MSASTAPARETTVPHVGGLHYSTDKAVVEHALGRRPGALAVAANPVAQTATVAYDPEQTSVQALTRWVEECGYYCAGQSVPGHICDPIAEHGAAPAADDHAAMDALSRPTATAKAVTPGCRWTRRCVTCATAC